MTIKRQFLEEFPTCIRKSNKPGLCELGELDSPVVFCVDKISKQIVQKSECDEDEHCDDFVFCNIKSVTGSATGIYCIENKMGDPKHIPNKKVQSQLQGGAEIIRERLCDSEQFRFMPVLVTPGKPNTWMRRLQGYKVTLGSQERRIRHVIVNDPLKPFPPYSTKPKTDKPAP